MYTRYLSFTDMLGLFRQRREYGAGRAGGGAILNYLISLNILQSILILQIQERAPGLTALNVKMLFGVFRYASGNTARSLTDGIQAGWISTHF